jgi:hypothetical protein
MITTLAPRYFCCAVLKLSTQIMLCLKLENSYTIPLYYIMIPVWIVLPVTAVDIFVTMLRRRQI